VPRIFAEIQEAASIQVEEVLPARVGVLNLHSTISGNQEGFWTTVGLPLADENLFS
jgi:hypothetical protein